MSDRHDLLPDHLDSISQATGHLPYADRGLLVEAAAELRMLRDEVDRLRDECGKLDEALTGAVNGLSASNAEVDRLRANQSRAHRLLESLHLTHSWSDVANRRVLRVLDLLADGGDTDPEPD